MVILDLPPKILTSLEREDIAKFIESMRMAAEQSESAVQSSPRKKVNDNCTAVPRCITGSGHLRKVVSHLFGRNKSQTKRIPPDCFLMYCRKHYQRLKFRCGHNGTWIFVQIDLIGKQLDRMESWGGVTSWNIILDKAHRDLLDAQDAASTKKGIKATRANSEPIKPSVPLARPDVMSIRSLIHDDSVVTGSSGSMPNKNPPASTPESESLDDGTDDRKPGKKKNGFPTIRYERQLLPHLGEEKSFNQVRYLLDLITFLAKETKPDDEEGRRFPGIQFIPNIDPHRKDVRPKNPL